MKECIFGIDIGGTNIKYGIFDLEGNLLHKFEVPTNRAGFKYVLSDIANAIQESRMMVRGVGVGVPGPVCDGVVNKCVNLNWEKTDFAKEFNLLLPDIPIKVNNDANLAALGEYWYGAGSKSNRLLFVTLGTGIGGGIIDNGKIVNGHNGAAAEIGHIPLPYIHDYSVSVAKAGYSELEQLASANGLVKCAQILLAENNSNSSLLQLKELSARAIIEDAQRGDLVAQRATTMAATYLAYGLSSVADVVNPECIVLGGGLSRAGSYFSDQVEAIFGEVVFHPNRQISIGISELGNDAGIYGAASLFIKQ